MALRPETPAMQPPDPRTLPVEALPGGELPDFLQIPKPRRPREEQQDAFLRERELDPALYYPPDVLRPLTQHYDEETFRVDIQALIDCAGWQVSHLARNQDRSAHCRRCGSLYVSQEV